MTQRNINREQVDINEVTLFFKEFFKKESFITFVYYSYTFNTCTWSFQLMSSKLLVIFTRFAKLPALKHPKNVSPLKFQTTINFASTYHTRIPNNSSIFSVPNFCEPTINKSPLPSAFWTKPPSGFFELPEVWRAQEASWESMKELFCKFLGAQEKMLAELLCGFKELKLCFDVGHYGNLG